MFRRAGSIKAVNALLHFLLTRVDPSRPFRGVWPIFDKAQEKDFRQMAFARLSELERDGALPANSVRLSDLTAAKGERLYAMFWHLSCEALRQGLARAQRRVPRVAEVDASSLHLGPAMVRAATLKVAQQRERFVLAVSRGCDAQRQWAATAAELEREWVAAHEQLTDLRRARRALKAPSAAPGVSTADVEQLRAIWRSLSEHAALDDSVMSTIVRGQQWPYMVRADAATLPAALERYLEALADPALAVPLAGADAAALPVARHQQQVASLQALQARLLHLQEALGLEMPALVSAASIVEAAPAVVSQPRAAHKPRHVSPAAPVAAPPFSSTTTPVVSVDARQRLAASVRRVATTHPSITSPSLAALDDEADATFLHHDMVTADFDAMTLNFDPAALQASPPVPKRLFQ